jgi:hypothetical protein
MTINYSIIRFDFSPTSIVIRKYKEDLITFLIKVSSVIGGVFTVLSIIDGLIYFIFSTCVKKAHLS